MFGFKLTSSVRAKYSGQRFSLLERQYITHWVSSFASFCARCAWIAHDAPGFFCARCATVVKEEEIEEDDPVLKSRSTTSTSPRSHAVWISSGRQSSATVVHGRTAAAPSYEISAPFTRQGHQEFVIFAKAQAYPTSLITDLVIVWSLPYLYMDILVL